MTTTPPPLPPEERRESSLPFPWLVVVPAVIALIVFLVVTPPDLIAVAGNWFLAKPYMVGYAVCHQIPSHSFIICEYQLPLCARCTGTFAGALIGFFGQAIVLRRRRVIDFPPPGIIAILIAFTLLWAFDGANSYLGSIIRGPHLYEPRHELRVLTGVLNGLTMSALVYPAFNVTFWRRTEPERAIRSLRDLGILVLLEAGWAGFALVSAAPWWLVKLSLDAARQIAAPSILLDAGSFILRLIVALQCVALYPLAWLSTLGVLMLLTSVNTMLVLIFIRRENVVDSWRGAVIPLLAGFALSLVQIGAITVVRFTFTGAFGPLPLPY
jgi:uncharacterized membrane protein